MKVCVCVLRSGEMLVIVIHCTPLTSEVSASVEYVVGVGGYAPSQGNMQVNKQTKT